MIGDGRPSAPSLYIALHSCTTSNMIVSHCNAFVVGMAFWNRGFDRTRCLIGPLFDFGFLSLRKSSTRKAANLARECTSAR